LACIMSRSKTLFQGPGFGQMRFTPYVEPRVFSDDCEMPFSKSFFPKPVSIPPPDECNQGRHDSEHTAEPENFSIAPRYHVHHEASEWHRALARPPARPLGVTGSQPPGVDRLPHDCGCGPPQGRPPCCDAQLADTRRLVWVDRRAGRFIAAQKSGLFAVGNTSLSHPNERTPLAAARNRLLWANKRHSAQLHSPAAGLWEGPHRGVGGRC
jgi:hypothetical protein